MNIVSEALETKDRTVTIIDTTSGGQVETVIEMLSPANKIGIKGRNRYETRRNAYISGGANLVEIDLLRTGEYKRSLSPADRLQQRPVSKVV